mmetsp:Transcript_17786/g.24596  ORF Transcript_17786/g.24596 Transcript_17786/m.24596 type:complete len:216 (+) Transcript_17786:384-1031(+)
MEKTFAIFKPDVASEKFEIVKEEIIRAGFTIIVIEKTRISSSLAEHFYQEHKNEPFFGKLIHFMCSGPLHAMVLGKENGVNAWKKYVGDKDPMVAKKESPKSLRARFGADNIRNAFHASDNSLSAAREIRLFFPRVIINPIPDVEEGTDFFIQHVQPTLNKGLTQLCRLKPAPDSINSVAWLADWLLGNNPNKATTLSMQNEESEQKNSDDVCIR